MLTGKTALVIDDEPGIRLLASRALKAAGCEVHDAADGNAGLKILERTAIDVVIIDIIMPEKEGVETIMEIKRRWPNIKVIAISGGGRIGPDSFLRLAEGLGADATMKKPLSFQELVAKAVALVRSATKAA
jgi:DNA-binding response OmpR family regulator